MPRKSQAKAGLEPGGRSTWITRVSPALPVLVASLVLVAAGLAWVGLHSAEEGAFDQATRVQATNAARLLAATITDSRRGLARVAQRSRLQLLTEAEWRHDAEVFRRDFPTITAIEWVDEKGMIRWVEPFVPAFQGVPFVEEPLRTSLLNRARASANSVISPLVPILGGGSGFFVAARVGDGSAHAGFLVTVHRAADVLRLAVGRPEAYGFAWRQSNRSMAEVGPALTPDRPEATAVALLGAAESGPDWAIAAAPGAHTLARMHGPLPDLLAAVLVALGVLAWFALHAARRAEANRLVSERVNDELRYSMTLLADSDRKLTLALSNARHGLWQWNIATGEVAQDETWAAIHGYGPGEITDGFAFWEASLHPADRERVLATLQAHLEDPAQIFDCDHRAKRKDGTYIWVNTRGRVQEYGPDGAPVFIMGSLHDIDHHKQVEAQLRAGAELLSRLSAEVPGMLYQWHLMPDGSHRFEYVSEGCRELYGLEPEAVLGDAMLVYGKLDPRDAPEVYAEVGRSAANLSRFSVRYRVESPIDEPRWMRCDASPVRLDDGSTVWFGHIADATAQVKAESELTSAREAAEAANRAKSEFLANMSHEIRTPLNGVIGMLGLLLDTPLEDDQREYAEIARSSGGALLAVLNDILDFSKIEAGRLSLESVVFDPISVFEGALDAVVLQAAEKGLELVVEIAPDLPRAVAGDPTRLRQIALNLLGNAVKFTDRGEVRLSVRRLADEGDAARIRVEVADTGIGLSEEQRLQLFRPFIQADSSTTRRFGGTGLGLSICKHLTELMGGCIGVDAADGGGALFWLELPLTPATEAGLAPLADLSSRRVIVAVHEPRNRAALTALIESRGGLAFPVATAADALARVRELTDSGAPPQAVLIDQDLQDEPGIWLAKALRSDGRGCAMALVLLAQLGRRATDPAMEGLYDRVITMPAKRDALLGAVVGRAPDTPTPGAAATDKSIAGMRVLLAEDNPVNQKLARRLLERLELVITVVDHGKAALDALRAGSFDVVLMDCQMPVLDGYAATRQIRAGAAGERARGIPIIALTAHALTGDRERCLEAGMDDYLTKPIDPSLLLARLQAQRAVATPESAAQLPAEPPAAIRPDPLPAHFVEATLLELVGGDAAFVADLLVAFVDDSNDRLIALLAAVNRQDTAAVAGEAHTLKGSATNVAANVLAAAAATVERSARDGRILSSEIEALRAAFHATISDAALRRYTVPGSASA